MSDADWTAAPPAPTPTQIKRLVEPLKLEAAQVRAGIAHEDGLTPDLFARLEPLLDTPTPAGAIKHEATYATVYLAWQIRCMDVVFGRRHWRWLVHHTNQGRTALAHVVIGNNLSALCLDKDTGELKGVRFATILARWEGSGDVTAITSRDPYKASRTSALGGLLALIGFGADVIGMLSRPRTSAVEVTAPAPTPMAGPSGRVAGSAAQPAPEARQLAEPVMMREIKDLARDRDIPDSQLIALAQQALGLPETPMGEHAAALRVAIVLSDRKVRFPHAAAIALKGLVTGAEPHLPVLATGEASDLTRASATRLGTEAA